MTRTTHVFYLIPIFVLAATTQADERAKQLAVAAHVKAAAIDNLPRLLIRGHGKTKSDHIIAEPDEDPLKNLVRALDPEVPEDQWYRYESLFAWDEEHFLDGRPAAETDSSRKIAGYPAAVFPYCILVDSQGNVAAHGRLRDTDAGLARRWHELRTSTKPSD